MLIKSNLILFSACLMILVLGGRSTAAAQISPEERQSLIMLYDHTGGDQWKVNTGWKTPPLAADGFAIPGTEQHWYGVTCNSANSTVKALRLRQAGLEGERLDFLSGLVNLRTLDLSDNRLSSNDYGFLSRLTQLRNLYLNQNVFRGTIMPSLAPLVELRRLNLSHNQFSDWDLSVLDSLPSLTYLDLRQNRFYGSPPSGLHQLQQLEHLDLSQNRLFGPTTLYLDHLKYVDLSDNQLEWDNCNLNSANQLEYFDFHNNRQVGFNSGPINAPQLKHLDLSHTAMGHTPAIENLNAIETIKMQNCRLMDDDINQFSGLATLKHLDLSHNMLGRDGNVSAPDANGWPALEYLNLSYNQFAWEQHVLTFEGSTQLKHLDLSHNHINTLIQLGDNVALAHMDLSYNALEHEPMLSNPTALQYYDVNHNNLSFDNLYLLSIAPELKHYDISHNKMSGHNGPIYFPWLGNNENLTYLNLSHNFLRIRDLDGLCDARNLTYLNLSHNQIAGNLPDRIDGLRQLRALNLTGNRLSGRLPAGIGLLENLERLYLGKNHLSIYSLNMLSGLSNLKQLHLDGNAMVGEIPIDIVSMQQLQKLEVGYNGLYTTDAEVTAFMDAKDPDWAESQTIAPEKVTVIQSSSDTAQIRWDPIPYRSGKGGYAVYYRDDASQDMQFTYYGTTTDKQVGNLNVTGLESGKVYGFKVQTRTEPSVRCPNLLISDDSDEAYLEIPVLAPEPPLNLGQLMQ